MYLSYLGPFLYCSGKQICVKIIQKVIPREIFSYFYRTAKTNFTIRVINYNLDVNTILLSIILFYSKARMDPSFPEKRISQSSQTMVVNIKEEDIPTFFPKLQFQLTNIVSQKAVQIVDNIIGQIVEAGVVDFDEVDGLTLRQIIWSFHNKYRYIFFHFHFLKQLV